MGVRMIVDWKIFTTESEIRVNVKEPNQKTLTKMILET